MSLRCKILTLNAVEQFVTEDCIKCGTLFAMTEALYDKRQGDGRSFWCPACGNSMHYTGKTDAQKLKDAEAREVALKDQLEAAVRDAEHMRQVLLRDRQRFANGVCPCCNRSFDNVRRHMTSKHPDYDATRLVQPSAVRFKCSCGRSFETMRGLRIHQGSQRRDNWAAQAQKTDYWSQRSAHLTDIGATR